MARSHGRRRAVHSACAARAARREDLGDADRDLTSIAAVAQVLPEHKHQLVRRLQDAGHAVGMTGDGVNDSPALRQAEVGIDVEGATDVAKAAAGAVLTRSGLTDIVALVQESRRIHQRSLTYAVNVSVKKLEVRLLLACHGGIRLEGICFHASAHGASAAGQRRGKHRYQ